ncbi:MAG: hypothetical protein IT286_02610 [Proteobacteria bacterium]|nr:hypothetical protein [Pseudomonadota bacterium]
MKKFLSEGNQQFVETRLPKHPKLAQPQTSQNLPICVVVGCADSRTCAEHIFSQSLGNFFSVRNAGHYITEDVVASIEYAISQGIKNIMIYGHTQCGAITATLQSIQSSIDPISPSVTHLLSRFEPTIRDVMSKNPELQGDALLRACTVANVHKAKKDILEKSSYIREKCKNDALKIMTGLYELETGIVHFLD